MGEQMSIWRRLTQGLLAMIGGFVTWPVLANTSGGDLLFVEVIEKLQKNALVVLAIIAVLGLVAALVKWAASQSNMEISSFGKWIIVIALIGAGVTSFLGELGLTAAVL